MTDTQRVADPDLVGMGGHADTLHMWSQIVGKVMLELARRWRITGGRSPCTSPIGD